MTAQPQPPVVTIKLKDVIHQLAAGRVRMDRQHGECHLCVVCGDDLMGVGITALAYTFEICMCGKPDFDHLVEQLWHRQCLADAISSGRAAADPMTAHVAAHGGPKYKVRR